MFEKIVDDASSGILKVGARSLRYFVAYSVVDNALCGSLSERLSSEYKYSNSGERRSEVISTERTSILLAITDSRNDPSPEPFGDYEISDTPDVTSDGKETHNTRLLQSSALVESEHVRPWQRASCKHA
jgi:hypothetical protein